MKNPNASNYFGFPETWSAINSALSEGLRGLDGGDTLHKLLVSAGLAPPNLSSARPLTLLTVEAVRAAISAYKDRTGAWPSAWKTRINVPELPPSDTWGTIDAALTYGERGLPGGASLALFIHREFGLALGNISFSLSEDLIWEACNKFKAATNKWPAQASGDATQYIGHVDDWRNIDAALRAGHRGLERKSSLASLIDERSGAGRLGRSDLALEMIHKGVRAFFDANGWWPNSRSGDATKYCEWPGSWSAVEARLHKGLVEGCPPKTTLRKLRSGQTEGRRQEGVRKPSGRFEPITEEAVRDAILAYQRREGEGPYERSGDATPYMGIPMTWEAVGEALRYGYRGLPGGSSLSRFKIQHGLTGGHNEQA